MSILRKHDSVPSRIGYFRVTRDTAWLYPMAQIQAAFATTTYKYTFDGSNIVCPDMENLIGLMSDIFAQTVLVQPAGNQGFSLGRGTLLQDYNQEIDWKLSTGTLVFKWRLAKLLTPQTTEYIPVPGNSLPDVIGYVVTISNYPRFYNQTLDDVVVVRLG